MYDPEGYPAGTTAFLTIVLGIVFLKVLFFTLKSWVVVISEINNRQLNPYNTKIKKKQEGGETKPPKVPKAPKTKKNNVEVVSTYSDNYEIEDNLPWMS